MIERENKLTAVEWRLYILAALATIYVIAWRVLDRSATYETPPAAAAPAPPVTRQAARWVITTHSAEVAPSPRLVRVPAKRRVRTRSS